MLFAKWGILSLFGIFVILIMFGIGGYGLSTNHTDISQEKPFNDFVGRDYRVIAPTDTMYWNDFPDKEKILTVSIGPASAENRFVTKSFSTWPNFFDVFGRTHS